MKLSYLILAHRQPMQFQRLIDRLDDTDVFFFVHVDKTTDETPFKKPFLESENVFFLEEEARMHTPWSDISICEVTIKLYRKAIERFQSNNYCILVSGQDYPIKSNSYIHNFYQSRYGQNFIDVSDIHEIWPEWEDRFERYNFHLPNTRMNKGIYPINDRRFFHLQNFKNILHLLKLMNAMTVLKTIFKPRRFHPSYLQPKGGSTWWALPVETLIDVDKYLESNPGLLKYHTYTHVPDETLFASILHKIRPPKEIQHTTTYTNWSRKDVTLPVTFGKNDFNELIYAGDGYLFARKFDIENHIDIMEQLDEHLNFNVHRISGS